MGDPRFARKKYSNPKKPWDKKLLDQEKETLELYGLHNKRELRRVNELLRNKRANAKKVLALPLEKRVEKEKELLNSLVHAGIMRGKPTVSEVLGLTLESLMERRLQTIVWRKHLANTTKQARQFITHGHIGINNKKVTIPSYMVTKEEEATIAYFGKPMILESPETAKKDKKQIEKDFAEMRGEPTGVETVLAGEETEKPVSPDATDALNEAETKEGK
ncbi:MAG: 30S ribosomal protein S4 [Candidatus Diapherotrites archaeon]